jgi:Bacterial Ig domain
MTPTLAALALALATGANPLGVSITAPPDWTFATKTVTVSAAATGGVAPVSARLVVDGTAVGTAVTAPPYTFAWDTTKLADGTHTIAVTATDASGATASSATLHETVDNTAPTAVMYQPAQNSRIAGTTTLQVHASDAFGVRSVQFTIDGKPVGAVLTRPDTGQQYLYSLTFDTTSLTPGSHAISALVTDNAGNTASPASVSITTGPVQYLPVVNYHGISQTDGSVYSQTPTEADQQLAYLKANGYTSVTLDQYRKWLGGADIGVAKPPTTPRRAMRARAT